jgi:sulfur carrier protein
MTGEGRPEPIAIVLNGEDTLVEPGTCIDSLVSLVGKGRRGVAVAIDGEVVPRSRWGSRTIAAGARVEIVSAAAGG